MTSTGETKIVGPIESEIQDKASDQMHLHRQPLTVRYYRALVTPEVVQASMHRLRFDLDERALYRD